MESITQYQVVQPPTADGVYEAATEALHRQAQTGAPTAYIRLEVRPINQPDIAPAIGQVALQVDIFRVARSHDGRISVGGETEATEEHPAGGVTIRGASSSAEHAIASIVLHQHFADFGPNISIQP